MTHANTGELEVIKVNQICGKRLVDAKIRDHCLSDADTKKQPITAVTPSYDYAPEQMNVPVIILQPGKLRHAPALGNAVDSLTTDSNDIPNNIESVAISSGLRPFRTLLMTSIMMDSESFVKVPHMIVFIRTSIWIYGIDLLRRSYPKIKAFYSSTNRMIDYHELYLKTIVLLLADILGSFKNTSTRTYFINHTAVALTGLAGVHCSNHRCRAQASMLNLPTSGHNILRPRRYIFKCIPQMLPVITSSEIDFDYLQDLKT
ncbi:hypothetical protein CHS0354_025805 [Potamilus streckersoni]|uniref:Uncharacterized protein n=1 Tax=Potamilus streckersoni TaxID=2493646 RepID=A0AAE0TCT7_9BIVA|nr:hypothetical protein CHS0354_025805 [Potamilus streckersoni]